MICPSLNPARKLIAARRPTEKPPPPRKQSAIARGSSPTVREGSFLIALSLWERAGVRGEATDAQALTLTLSQRERGIDPVTFQRAVIDLARSILRSELARIDSLRAAINMPSHPINRSHDPIGQPRPPRNQEPLRPIRPALKSIPMASLSN